MKTIKKIALTILLLNLVSCTPYSYFQVYTINSDNTKKTNSDLIFENEDLTLEYNFWSPYGNEDFNIYNKTDSNIFVDLSLSHFIINKNALTYYQNREWTKKRTTSIASSNSNSISSNYYYLSYPYNVSNSKSIGVSSSSQNGITYKEKRIIVIPPHSKKKINNGYVLNNILLANCDVNKFPKNSNNISKINFNSENTPYTYENYLTYSFNKEIDKPKTIKNTFWVNEILFLPHNEFYVRKYNTNCGVKDFNSTLYYNYAQSNRFFIEYKKEAKFINLTSNNNITDSETFKNTKKEDVENYGFKVGDEVTFKIGFSKYEGKIIEFKAPYDFIIEYTNKYGKTKKIRKEHTWIKKKN